MMMVMRRRSFLCKWYCEIVWCCDCVVTWITTTNYQGLTEWLVQQHHSACTQEVPDSYLSRSRAILVATFCLSAVNSRHAGIVPGLSCGHPNPFHFITKHPICDTADKLTVKNYKERMSLALEGKCKWRGDSFCQVPSYVKYIKQMNVVDIFIVFTCQTAV
jgi:hypothetical protein